MTTPLPLEPLPPASGLETSAVLKKAISASRSLAELKGAVAAIPSETILIGTLTLQEAKDSSAVENIATTHDELYKAGLSPRKRISPAAREVRNHAAALQRGFGLIRENKIIRLEDILEIQQTLEKNDAGLRKVPGTVLKNEQTGEAVYTPPQDAQEIERLMDDLIQYINVDEPDDADPLIKMAMIHHRFESIHPFHDGNGRTGRILNILYLVSKGLLDLPVLYLSRYIIRTRPEYYRRLQGVRANNTWEPWLLYMLEGVNQTAVHTISLIRQIKSLMQDYKHRIRKELPKIYSQELLNSLFQHVYTRISFVENDLGVSYLTASKYLNSLVEREFLLKKKIGRGNYYINQPLFELFLPDSPAAPGE